MMRPELRTLVLLIFSALLTKVLAVESKISCVQVSENPKNCQRCDAGTSQKSFYLSLLTNHSKASDKPGQHSNQPKDELKEADALGISATFVTVGDDAFVYRGQVAPVTGDRKGVGFVIGKAFPLLYIGGWFRGYKEGFGINIDFCGGNFVLQAGMWSQGLFYRTAAIPEDLKKILTELSGCVDVMAVLERALPYVPPPIIPEWSEESEEEFLQNRGLYHINVSDTKYAFDIHSGSHANGAILIHYSHLHEGTNQQFMARRVGKNTFILSPKHAPCMALDLKSQSNHSGVDIVQQPFDLQKDSQKWIVEKNPDETFSLRNVFSKLYMTANNEKNQMIQSAHANSPKQRFLFRKVSQKHRKKANPSLITPEKEYMVRNRHDGKFLDVCGGSTSNGTEIIPYDAHGNNNQVFRFIQVSPTDPTVFYIESLLRKDKVLDVSDNNTNDGAKVILWDRHGGRNQQWRLLPIKEEGEDDDIQFQSVLSNKCLEVTCDKKIRMATCDSKKDSQLFSLQRREISPILTPGMKYRINIRANSKRLAVNAGPYGVPANNSLIVQQLPLAGSKAQVFQFILHEDDQYSIHPEGSQMNLALSPFQPGTKGTERIVLREYNQKDKLFRWKLIEHNGIYYYLQNVGTNFFLEAAGDSADVFQSTYGQRPEQLFAFEPLAVDDK
jgi:hypothetical protein